MATIFKLCFEARITLVRRGKPSDMTRIPFIVRNSAYPTTVFLFSLVFSQLVLRHVLYSDTKALEHSKLVSLWVSCRSTGPQSKIG